ncbi:MAG: glycosyltransferase family 4 protein [Acidobacteriota bacterium]|nr:glycosyltransferase family 4 protein [Acidobacteriota bacterium]
MKIAIDVRRIRDFGVGTYIRNLLQALAGLGADHQYDLICCAEDRPQFSGLPPNFRTVIYNRRDSSRLDHLDLPRLLHGLGAAVTHIPFHRVPLLMPKPYLVTIHDLSSLFFDDASGLLHAARTFRLRRGLERAGRIIAVSGATQRDVINLVPTAEDRIRLIYSAPDPQFMERRLPSDARTGGPEAAARERHRILERYQIRYPFLLYAGSIRKQKNIPRLIEAFAVARSSLEGHVAYKDLRLIIIGDEISRHPDVRRAVIQSRVESCVRFLGFIPFDTLRIFHELATAFVFPSLYEGFGLPPLEAMASGTPVIASAVSSLPEVVGGAAMLVNPENVFDIARGITEVLLNDGLRESMILKGRKQAASFSWPRTAREVLDLYEELGSANRGQPSRAGSGAAHSA